MPSFTHHVVTTCLLLVCLFHTLQAISQTNYLSTFIGGTYGDNGPATKAFFPCLSNIFPAPDNSTYLADSCLYQIKRILPNETVVVIAGNGMYGFSGDNGPATVASFTELTKIVVNSKGEVFVVDRSNFRIRKVYGNGVVSTIAGNGAVNPDSFYGLATNVTLLNMNDIFLSPDENTLYIADGNLVKNLSLTTGMIGLYAGGAANGMVEDMAALEAQFQSVDGLAMDSSGNLYIADQTGEKVYVVFAVNQTVKTFAGNSSGSTDEGIPATSAKLTRPSVVKMSPSGELYIVCRLAVVKRVDVNGTITTVAGNCLATGNLHDGDGGPATLAAITFVTGVGFLNDELLILQVAICSVIRRVSLQSGIISRKYGMGFGDKIVDEGTPIASTIIMNAYMTAFSPNGDMYISTGYGCQIRKVSGGLSSIVVGSGVCLSDADVVDNAKNATITFPKSIAILPSGELIFAELTRIRKVLSNGTLITIAGSNSIGFSGDGGPAINAVLNNVNSLAVNSVGEIFLADSDNYRVRKIDLNGNISTIVGTGTAAYNGDGILATDANVDPRGVAISQNGEIYIADYQNNRARKVLTNGTITTIAGNGQFAFPFAPRQTGLATNVSLAFVNFVAVASNGDVFFTFFYGYNVLKLSQDGYLSIVVGTADTRMLTPHEGIATNVRLANLGTVAIAPSGDLYVTNYGDRVSRIFPLICGGVSASDSGVCGGHGSCISPENCNCTAYGYSGSNCSIPSCFGILQTNSSVCSGRGQCITPDSCLCDSGYFPANCSIPICFDIEATRPSVCSSHGVCTAPDTCNCYNGYSGRNCSVVSCFGIVETDSKVCSGNGVCNGLDSCLCKTGFTSANCSVPTCFGVAATSPFVCSSNGKCTATDVCVCNSVYFGFSCGTRIVNDISVRKSTIINSSMTMFAHHSLLYLIIGLIFVMLP